MKLLAIFSAIVWSALVVAVWNLAAFPPGWELLALTAALLPIIAALEWRRS